MTKQKTNWKIFGLIAAGSLGLATGAFAQNADLAPPVPTSELSAGLLGKGYTAIGWNYVDLDGSSPSAARGLTAAFNQPLRAGLDLNVNYDWLRAGVQGVHLTQQQLEGGVTAYQAYSWGKPFVEAGAGWVWARGGGASTDSFAFHVGSGVEFAVAPRLSVAPFVEFRRATGFNANQIDLGAKVAYRLTREWSAVAKVQYDAVRHDRDQREYSLGVAYHF
ncbi:hypothetical protein K0B96_00655 [Horticoccus luteus]|uniref:Outer membrane protein beta-barrel domain-containing protein n=1 Tax=Horticoccus luteus TaxID=2862869 RepID=A0A8F9TWQ4_9BACT|nr:hypothetical protein [Horticoccus luteus]QYM79158.1 hypothetical protein K0B96_00655 [Horticoccus luteus]